MTRMELLAYLSANLFRIYTLFRFTENFFSERKTTVRWIIISFLIYFSINIALYSFGKLYAIFGERIKLEQIH